MRILILGAGAIGGYFGGRLVQGGKAEVAFLVREQRRERLRRDGLTIQSPLGNFETPVRTVTAQEVAPHWDVVVLTCKAYDLDEAIEAMRPAITEGTAILPLLNGMSHLDRLRDVFGPKQVLGGLAYISAVLTSEGTIRHLSPLCRFAFGDLDGHLSSPTRALHAAFEGVPIQVELVDDIVGHMWEKLVGLGGGDGADAGEYRGDCPRSGRPRLARAAA